MLPFLATDPDILFYPLARGVYPCHFREAFSLAKEESDDNQSVRAYSKTVDA
jgi:hypothetical protein